MGSNLSRFAVLNDPGYNEIEVFVEKIYSHFCFSHGWPELNGLYNLKHGVAVTLVNVQANRFVIQVKDRYGEEINYPKTNPPMSLRLNRDLFSSTLGSLFTTSTNLPYRHDPNNFKFCFSKWLSDDEIKKGFLVWCFHVLINMFDFIFVDYEHIHVYAYYPKSHVFTKNKTLNRGVFKKQFLTGVFCFRHSLMTQ